MTWSAAPELGDLLTLACQTALLLGVGLCLPTLLALRHPKWRSIYWHGLLASCLLVPLGGLWRAPVMVFSADLVVVAEQFLPTPGVLASARPLPMLPFVAVWAVGAGLYCARLGLGMLALRRWRREAAPWTGDVAVDDARKCLAPAGHSAVDPSLATAPFLVSRRVTSPVTCGLRRPVVLVPQDFTRLDAAERRAIAAHELLHIRRRDGRRLLFEELLRAVLWFHPAVWCLLPRIQLCREQLIDRHVVDRLGRRPYLQAMCHYAAGSPSWSPAPALSLFHTSHLRQRVAALTQEVSMSRQRTISTVTVLAALLSLTALTAYAVFPWASVYADEAKILFVEDDVKAPVRTYGPAPSYPSEIAKEDRIEGTVVVKATINRQGTVDAMEISESLAQPFDQAAMDAIAQWRFEPATLDGEPVAVYYFLTINFRLG